MSIVRTAGFGFATIAPLAMLLSGHVEPRTGADASLTRHVSSPARLEALRRAQVWTPTNVAARDIRTGPHGHGAFAPGQSVVCDYRETAIRGGSPKFWCAIGPNDVVKVKYGAANGEVYAEVAATRLFWALGFFADRMYPVRVECHGCSRDPFRSHHDRQELVVFDPAAIERKMDGATLEVHADSGWAWPELDLVDESAGGAPRAHRDALKLLAVLVQHTDSKPSQQRLACLPRDGQDDSGACTEPVMMVDDLGQTFGRANLFNRDSVGGVNFDEWSKARVWKDPTRCVGDLPISQTGSLENPRISEAGRRFLADLLVQLADDQLRALFEVARFAERDGAKRRATVDDWVAAFKQKRDQIVHHSCPA